jgi:hypothetical protein
MKWLPDSTGRFKWRPYYDGEELDIECERTVSRFLEDKYGMCCYPLSTDDLTVMIEQDTSDFDLYADLSGAGEDVEGLTDFVPNRKPAVKIAMELSLDSRKEHRLRTTLAHEYGHVKFHTFLWELSRWENPARSSRHNRKYYRLYNRSPKANTIAETSPRCKSSRILDAPFSDWMEWQASYACGAFLMPLSAVRHVAGELFRNGDGRGWLPEDSDDAVELTDLIANAFNVSHDAARVRLQKLGYLQKISDGCSLLQEASVFSARPALE